MSGSDESKEVSKNISRKEPASPSSSTTSNNQIPESTHRSKVIDQARKFLEEDDIKNAEKGKKTSFLQSKGLSNEEIEDLLNVNEKKKIIVSTAKNASSGDNPENEPQSVTTNLIPQTSQAPPIITYPEFLINSSPKSPPLITASRLVTILYSISILTATLYGTLEYIVTPMLSKLTDSRHELFCSILLKLHSLSQKLESQVSQIPVMTPHIFRESDAESEDIDDDPTELFHRDIGIQTSPPGSPQPKNTQLAQGSLTHQTAHLCGLYTYLRDINNHLANETQNNIRLENAVTDLRKYLNTLAYPPRPINNYDSIYLSNGIMAGHNTGNGVNGDMNEATKVKKEIKGMKGILLSARSFPGLKAGLYQK